MSEPTHRDDWDERDALFARVLDRPPEERAAFLSGLREVDDRLRQAVLRLLRMHEEAEDFLEEGPVLPEDLVDRLTRPISNESARDGAPAAVPGERVGPWRVLEEIGRGGMATVYLVERADGLYEQQAALKLLRRGIDTDDVLRRFRAERRILSSLTHEGIARLLDGGRTPDGRPYFVMERIEGLPITDWCGSRRTSVEERLRLFVAVAEAVHHAHTKLVIHRDLKPSNILVTPDGRPKLLDFGIAKILDPDFPAGERPRTRTGHRALTPEYASPEQIRGDPPTTATDVYQLGLLLHRLLSGARPHEARGPSHRLGENPTPPPRAPSRIVRQQQERTWEARGLSPARLAGRLRGDLDAIVLCALEADPDRRYASAREMSEDVKRHLAGLPITVRTAGGLYRLRKLLQRHRWVGPAAIAALLVLTAFAFTRIRHGQQLRLERDAATEQAERAERVRDVLIDVFRSADPWSASGQASTNEATLTEALDVGVALVDSTLSDEPELRADLLTALADAYIGLGRPERARPLLETALRIRRAEYGPVSEQAAEAAWRLGSTLNDLLKLDTAAVVLRDAYETVSGLEDVPDSLLLGPMVDLAFTQKYRPEEAERLLVSVTKEIEAGRELPPQLVMRTYTVLSLLYTRLGRSADAVSAAERSLAEARRHFGREHPATASALWNLAATLWRSEHEQFGEAIALQEQAVDILDRRIGPDHPQAQLARIALSGMYRSSGRIDDAEHELRQVLDRRIALFGEEDPRSISALHHLALLFYNKGELEEAERTERRAMRARSPYDLVGLATSEVLFCGIELYRENYAEAEKSCRRAFDLLRAAEEATGVRIAACRLGEALNRLGRAAEAIPLFEQALPELERAATVHPPGYTHECLSFAASAYAAVGRAAESDSLTERAASYSRRGIPGVVR